LYNETIVKAIHLVMIPLHHINQIQNKAVKNGGVTITSPSVLF